MIKVAILGATGYTGVELIKILLRHPQVKISALVTRQQESIPLQRLIPTLPENFGLEIRQHSFEEIMEKADVVFLCLPHTEAAEAGARCLKSGKIVIDLSADFRLKDAKQYERWYHVKHKQPAALKKAVYGLPELYREKIKNADLIANPGCYPTGAALGLLPLVQNKLIDLNNIVIDSKSGVSGAGKKINQATQFCEIEENFYAYKVGIHQHIPEIEQTLSAAAGKKVLITFVPHLLPIDRGILTTIYAQARKGVKENKLIEAYKEAYQEEPFVRVKPRGSFPMLRDVQHTNYCDIGLHFDPQSGRIIVITAIDNLLKGASGQAIQNMNIRCGFSEEEGMNVW